MPPLTTDDPLATTPPGTAPGGLGGAAVRGAGWVFLASIAGKGLTLASQLVLAFLLAPEAFGLAAMATAAASATAVLGASNFIALLVQRQDRFEAEAGQVFWMALVSGLVATGGLVAAAPAVATAFGEPSVAALTRVVALAIPFQALTTVYAADLLRSLRFRALTLSHLVMLVTQHGLTVVLAFLGWGAYAIVVPVVAAAVVGLVAQWAVADPVSIGRPRVRTWGLLAAPAVWLFAVTGAQAVLPHVSNVVIGLFQDADVVGYYFWGYMLAAQVVLLLTEKLRDVFFPTLAKLNAEPERQRRAFREAADTLLFVAAALCVAQAAAAAPAVELVFGDRWRPAIPVVEALSLALVVQPLIGLTSALLLARGAYPLLTALTVGNLAVMAVATGVGAMAGTQEAIAAGAAIGFVLVGMVYGAVGFRAAGGTVANMAGGVGRVTVAGGVGLGAAVAVMRTVPGGDLVRVVAGPLVAVTAFALAARLLFPQAVLPLARRVWGLLQSARS